jgi:alpha-tubulin suppressor-like RCC1 family protein
MGFSMKQRFDAARIARRWWSAAVVVAMIFGSPALLAESRPAAADVDGRMLDAGAHYACAIREDGGLACWGVMNDQQIDPPVGTFAAVSVGADLACGLRADGELACWGGPAPASPPSGPFIAVSAGAAEACALRPNGTLACWGGTMAAAAPTGSGHIDVGVANGRGCAIRADGGLACWQAAGVSDYGPTPSGRFIAVDPGASHVCALRSDGQAVCWGANAQGQSAAPSGAFLAVATGDNHSCAIRVDGTLACWGDNAAQQLAVPAGRFTALAAGGSHACARRENGAMVCWGGDGSRGELNPPGGEMGVLLTLGGNGDIVCVSRVSENQSDTDTRCAGNRTDLIPPAQPFTAISLGDNSGCGLLRDGSAQCWGASLGAIPQGQSYYKIAVGGGHACALNQNQNIVCWGDNSVGQATPPQGYYLEIVSGDRFSCALRSYSTQFDRGISCWGEGAAVSAAPVGGDYSNLHASGGNVCGFNLHETVVRCWGDAGAEIAPPIHYFGFTSIAVGDHHACGVLNYTISVCWGSNAQGQLAAPSVDRTYAMVAAGDTTCITSEQGLSCWGAHPHALSLETGTGRFGIGAIALGEHHSCTLRGSGHARCWGEADLNQRAVPQGYKRALTAGGDHACAIGGDGALACWGDNTHDGATPVAGAVRSAEAGHFNGCAVRGDGEGACWGWNSNGQGTPPAGPFRALATGLNHSCGVRDDGNLSCWGYNADGQTSAPAGAFVAVDVGERHSCALNSVGGLQCWGLGSEGQTTPPAAAGIAYRALASGAFHNCAIRSDGALACWGRNDRGQATPPQGVYVSVSAGFAHTCAIRDNGARACWGNNDSGQAPQLSITPQTLPDGVVDALYEVRLGAQGSATYAPEAPGYAVVAGELPPGIGIGGTRPSLLGVPGVPGTYSFTLEATDANGLSGRRDYQITVLPAPDTTPPEIEPLITGVGGNEFWYRSDVNLQWRITDAESTISSTEGCAETNVVEDTDELGLRFTCIATSAGGSSDYTVVIKRDTLPPDTVYLETPPTQNNYGVQPQRFVIGIVDANPAESPFECTTHPEIPDSFSGPCSSPFVFYSGTLWPWGIPQPGTFTVQYRARDLAGNVDPTPASHTWTILSDPTPPAIVPILVGTQGDNGWYIGDVSLRWSVLDPETPFIHRGECPDYALNFDTRGEYRYCEARSWGGLSTYPLTLRRDTGIPTLYPAPQSQPNGAGWYRSPVQVYFFCDDAISGVAQCPPLRVLAEEGAAVTTGPQTARDHAGHVSAPSSFTARIDMTSPVITAAPTTAPIANGWYNADVTVAFACSDALSGLSHPCPQSQVLTQQGFNVTSTAQTISDIAGNLATSNTVGVDIDKTPPTISAQAVGFPNGNGWYNRDVVVRFTCSDALSGIAVGECPPDITVSEEGANVTRIATVRDKVGWTGSTSIGLKIDKTPPFLASPAVPAQLVLNATYTVTPNASDALSGLASSFCVMAGGTGTIGEKTVTCTATDRAGNTVSRSATYRVVYDFVPLSAPLSNPAEMYVVQAPRSVPLEWRLRDANGAPVANAILNQASATEVSCPAGTGVPFTAAPVGEVETTRNFGDGRYRRNWWINYTGVDRCLRLDVVLNDGIVHSATIRVVPKRMRTGGPQQPSQQATPVAPRSMPSSQPATPTRDRSQPLRRGVKPAKNRGGQPRV